MDVGQVEFTVLPVPPEAAADAELLEPLELAGPEAAVVELELEQAATGDHGHDGRRSQGRGHLSRPHGFSVAGRVLTAGGRGR
jgi:hypothetical protein